MKPFPARPPNTAQYAISSARRKLGNSIRCRINHNSWCLACAHAVFLLDWLIRSVHRVYRRKPAHSFTFPPGLLISWFCVQLTLHTRRYLNSSVSRHFTAGKIVSIMWQRGGARQWRYMYTWWKF